MQIRSPALADSFAKTSQEQENVSICQRDVFLLSSLFLLFSSLARASRRFCVPPDQRMIYKETNSYRQRNYAERRRDAAELAGAGDSGQQRGERRSQYAALNTASA